MEKKNYFHGANIEHQGKKIGVALYFGSCAEVCGEVVAADGSKKEIKVTDCGGKQTFVPRAVLIEHVTGTGKKMKKFIDICLRLLKRQICQRPHKFRH